MKNQFETDKFRDHRIVNEVGETVGHVRVKPSSILWAPKNAKVWYGMSIDEFGQMLEQQGKKQAK